MKFPINIYLFRALKLLEGRATGLGVEKVFKSGKILNCISEKFRGKGASIWRKRNRKLVHGWWLEKIRKSF